MFTTIAAEKFLTKHSIMPQDWKIPQAEQERINVANIGMVVFYTPASSLDLSLSPWINNCSHLIALDGSYLDSGAISQDQQVGIILHEIGHILNRPPYDHNDLMKTKSDHNLDDEFYADYYAHHCGYGAQFISAMRCMRSANIYGFNSIEIDQRIQALDQSLQVRLNLFSQ
jgi:hypothetical protein